MPVPAGLHKKRMSLADISAVKAREVANAVQGTEKAEVGRERCSESSPVDS